MRFNSRELAQLAQQAASVDKEGVLYMKEKQDSIFKTKEVYIDRYFRLKGNLLFYFKNKETRAEPLGVLVVERCTVELDLEEEALNSFVVVCEGEDNPFKFAAISEEERDSWIQALHLASYECLKMQLQSLREQVQAKTGRDPVTLPDSSSSGLDLDIQTDSASEDPVLEISLSCKDLPCDSQGSAPNSLVLVHIIVPQQQQLWVHHNHTEISDKNCNPMFLKTIGFGDANGVETSTRVRLTVYNVKERMTGTMAQLGQAIFTLQDVLMAHDMTLTLNLQSHDIKSKGKITMMAWINDNKVCLADLQQASSPTQTGSMDVPPRSARTMSTAFVRDSLRTHFDNVIKRSFRFATNSEAVSLQVHEYMAEFQHSFNIPVHLLRIWIDEEKQKNSLLQDLGELWAEWEAPQIAWITLAARTAEHYTNILDTLIEYQGPSFKRSVEKDRAELEFVAVNLHLQSMAVTTDGRSSSGVMYNVMTMGAPLAFNKKFKNGGLRRMLQQQRTAHTAESTLGPRTKLQRACALRNEATDLRADIVQLCERLTATVEEEGSLTNLQAAVTTLTKKARELVGLCKDQVLCSAADMYVQAKRQGGGTDRRRRRRSGTCSPPLSPRTTPTAGQAATSSRVPPLSPGVVWLQEVTRLNLEAAVVCLVSLVDGAQGSDLEGRRTEVREGVSKLQTFVDLVSAKISLFLTFLTMMENKDSIQRMHEIKYRRDIVNSQAITAMVGGVCAMVQHADFTSQRSLQQLQHCGLLVQWEGLLSCFGDEMGMIEDFAVAVDDLRFVTLQFVRAQNDDMDPTVSMGSHIKDGPNPDFNRHGVCVHIPVQDHIFSQLTKEMQEGQQVSVCPVLFNIGINEDATYAETRFGSTALQEHINSESLANLHSYYESVASLHCDPVEKVGGPGTVSHLLKLLHSNVAAIKKSKNVEVLHLASEICQRLRGVRITACKSGKDRTAMGVTLEMIQILQRHHDLAPHVFSQALDCLRSVGCRRENNYKNTGVRKYAFNRFQMLYIPKLYRAPGGTYGNIIT